VNEGPSCDLRFGVYTKGISRVGLCLQSPHVFVSTFGNGFVDEGCVDVVIGGIFKDVGFSSMPIVSVQ